MLGYVLMTPAELIASSLILPAFASAIAIIALAFSLGEAFSIPSIRAFAKSEAYELIVTAVIFITALLLILPGGPFDMAARGFALPICDLNGNPPGCVQPDRVCTQWMAEHGPYDPATGNYQNGNLAYGQADYFLGCRPVLDLHPLITLDFEHIPDIFYVDGVMMGKLWLGYGSLMVNEMLVGFLSGFSTNLSIPVPIMPIARIDVGLVPFIGLGQVNDIHTLIVDFVGQLWAAFAAQKILLVFIEENALQVFLPLGLLMRAFPFSRKTGSTIIAVVFAMYFVYPTSILINQRIWQQISDPVENINRLGEPCTRNNAADCATDSECCSNNCLYTGNELHKKCYSQITDFTKYKSLYAICYGGKSPDEINAYLDSRSSYYFTELQSVYFGGESLTAETKTEARLRDYRNILEQKIAASEGVAETFFFPNPRATMIASFRMVETLVTDISQFAVLALLFIVIEIVITLTLFKDFALLIGGEPRILGITQLV